MEYSAKKAQMESVGLLLQTSYIQTLLRSAIPGNTAVWQVMNLSRFGQCGLRDETTLTREDGS